MEDFGPTVIRFGLASAWRRPGSMLVVALVGLLATMILSMSGTVLATGIMLPAPPQHYSEPILVAGPAGFPLPDQERQVVPYPELARLPDGTRERVLTTPGVDDAVEYLDEQTERLVAIGVEVERSSHAGSVAERLRASLGSGVQVLTGSQRGYVEDPSIPTLRVPLVVAGSVGSGVLLMVIAIVIWSALGLVLRSRVDELRLWALIGATPSQLRRILTVEVVAVATAGAIVGALVGYNAAGQLFKALTRFQVLPPLIEPAARMAVIAAASLSVVSAIWATSSLISAPMVRRTTEGPQRIASGGVPSQAARRTLGAFAAASAVAMFGVAPFLGPEAGVSVGGPATLVAVCSVAAIAPALMVAATPLTRRLTRAHPVALVADPDVRYHASRLGSVMVLLTLGVTLALANGYTATTIESATGPEVVDADATVIVERSRANDAMRVIDRAVGPSGVMSRVMTSVGWIEEPYDHKGSDPVSVIGIDEATSLTSVDVTSGSLEGLDRRSIAITASDSRTLGVDVGDPVVFRFGDGDRQTLKVAAVIASEWGTGFRLVNSSLLASHVAGSPVAIAVKAPQSANSTLATHLEGLLQQNGVPVEVKSGAGVTLGTEGVEFGNLIYGAVAVMALLFTTLVACQSIVAFVLSRRDEFVIWNRVGATRRQLLCLAQLEMLQVAALALVCGGVIAALSVLSASAGLRAYPSGSPFLLAVVVCAVLGVSAIAAAVPMLRATRSM